MTGRHRTSRPTSWRRWLLFGVVLVSVLVALLVHGVVDSEVGASGLRPSVGVLGDSRLEQAGPVLDLRRNGFESAVPHDRTIALTFDDGPDPRWTPQLLEMLDTHHAKATFFLTGKMVSAHAELARRVVESGHEIGSHTFTHADISNVARWRVQRELDQTQAAIGSATGKRVGLFRPPYIGHPDEVDRDGLRAARWVADDGYLIVLSQLDGEDWVANVRADEILDRIRPQGDKGAVILLHDAGGDRRATLEATGKLLDELSARGYEFTTVSGALGSAPLSSMTPASSGTALRGTALIWGLRLSSWALTSLQVIALILAVLLIIRSVVSVALARRHARKPRPPVWLELAPVTVVVPAYNEAAGIEAAVRSISASRYPETEVIVVDDGSTDDTAVIVESLGLANVRLVSKENGGKPSALNRGVREATHDIIVSVDGDTMFEPETLFWLVQHLQDPAVGAVAGNTKVANRRGVLGRWQHLEYVVGFNYDRRAFDLFDCMATVPGAIGAFRRSALVRVGLFTDDTLAEDTDITIALNRAGWYVPYEERAVAWTEAPSNLRGLWRQRYRWSYGTMQALWKHRSSVFDRGTGKFGRRGLPYILLFQVILPLLGPVVDVFALYGVLFSDKWLLAWYCAGFTLLQVAGAAYALHLDGESLRDLWALPIQLFVYRQLMYLVIVNSVTSAISGTRLRWQRPDRVGVGSIAGTGP